MTIAVSQATAIRLASWITAINVLVASGFSIAGVVSPEHLLPAGSVPTRASLIFAMYAASRTVPLAVITIAAIYKRSASTLLILGMLAGIIQLLDAGVGLFQNDLGKTIGPIIIAILQLFSCFILANSSKRSM
jgi:hypothetical protein